MSDAADKPKLDILNFKQTCNIKGRVGRFYVVKLCPRKARVLPVNMPSGLSFLVDKSALRNIEGIQPSLFPSAAEETPEPSDDEQDQPAKPAKRASRILTALPYGLFDLDPSIVTDPGPPFRVRCYIRDCTEMLRPPTRGFRGDTCPKHGIRTHCSGNSVTYTYARAERNIIASPALFKHKLRGHPDKFETHRFGYENSEDALTWNVFRSLQEVGCLHEIARYITGLDTHEEPTLYLWGLRMSDDSLELWDLLTAARNHFETNRLPVKRPATEPDIGIHLQNKFLILIEAKLGSGNTCYTDGERKNPQSLTKNELLDIYQHSKLQILDVEKAKAANRVFYQLWRNMQFAEYMAMLDGPHTLGFHANLVRAGCEHESTSEFRQLIKPGYEDRFSRLTWETIFTLTGLCWRRLTRLQEYMMAKTLGLAPAFNLDLW
jgi:hypothetical protein